MSDPVYLAFSGEHYQNCGGADDMDGVYGSLQEAIASVESRLEPRKQYTWAHVAIVCDGKATYCTARAFREKQRGDTEYWAWQMQDEIDDSELNYFFGITWTPNPAAVGVDGVVHITYAAKEESP